MDRRFTKISFDNGISFEDVGNHTSTCFFMSGAQTAYDNQEPNLVDPIDAIQERINEITEACREKGFLYDGGNEYLAARHVHDHMDFALMYSIIQNAQTMDYMQLGEFVKSVVTKAIETAAEFDVETGGEL